MKPESTNSSQWLVASLELNGGKLQSLGGLQSLSGYRSAQADGDSLRLVQITDCHLGETVGEKLAGMDTDASLNYVVDQIASDEVNTRLLVATGDLANHGSDSAYRRLRGRLNSLPMPSAWLPGNHDNPGLMRQAVGAERLPGVVLAGNWAIVLLDSTVAGAVGGELGNPELQRLQKLLELLPANLHILAFVHHQVLPVGSEWLDQQQISDSDKLLAMLAGETRLKAVVSGHVHQEMCASDSRLPGVSFITSPSTCIQFAPKTPDFKIDDKQPGYRWFDLHADGRLDTGVVRVENTQLTMDLASSGY